MAEKITTWYDDIWLEWVAFEGDYDIGVPVGYGKTEAEAVKNLIDELGEEPEPEDCSEQPRDPPPFSETQIDESQRLLEQLFGFTQEDEGFIS